MVRRQRANNAFSTTLTSAVNDTTTTFPVASVSGFPTEGDFFVSVSGETVLVTDIATLNLTVIRGQEGTTAESHVSGAAVDSTITAGEFYNRANEMAAIKTLAYGRLVDSSGNALTASSFTDYNGGASAITDFADGVVGYECKAHTANDVSGACVTRASTLGDFQITVHFDCPIIDDGSTPNYFGLMQRQATGGQMKGIVLYPNVKVEVHERATFLSTPGTINATHGSWGRRDMWFRLKVQWDVVSSTDYFTWYYSVDGVHWWQMHQHTFASSAIQVGIWQSNRTIDYRRSHILSWHEELI